MDGCSAGMAGRVLCCSGVVERSGRAGVVRVALAGEAVDPRRRELAELLGRGVARVIERFGVGPRSGDSSDGGGGRDLCSISERSESLRTWVELPVDVGLTVPAAGVVGVDVVVGDDAGRGGS